VDLDHGVPLRLGHVGEHAVAQDAGVVDEHVEITEGLDGGVDEPLRALPRRDVVAVGGGLAAGALDLGHDLLGRTQVATCAVDVAAEVVHDDLGAVAGERQGVLATDATPGAGHDGDASVQESAHGGPSCPVAPAG